MSCTKVRDCKHDNVLNFTGLSDLSISNVTVRPKKKRCTRIDLTNIDERCGDSSPAVFADSYNMMSKDKHETTMIVSDKTDGSIKNPSVQNNHEHIEKTLTNKSEFKSFQKMKKSKHKNAFVFNAEVEVLKACDIVDHTDTHFSLKPKNKIQVGLKEDLRTSETTINENYGNINSIVSHCALESESKVPHSDVGDLALEKHKKKMYKRNSKHLCTSDTTIVENLNERNSMVSHCAVESQGKVSHADVKKLESEKHKKKKRKRKSNLMSEANDALENLEGGQEIGQINKKLKTEYYTGNSQNDNSDIHEDLHTSDTTVTKNFNERNSVVSHCAVESQGKASHADVKKLESEKHKKKKRKRKSNLMSESNYALKNLEGEQEIGQRKKKSKTEYYGGNNQNDKSNIYEDLHTSGTTVTENRNEKNSVVSHCAVESQDKGSYANLENFTSVKRKKKKHKSKSNLVSEANALENLVGGQEIGQHKKKLKKDSYTENNQNKKSNAHKYLNTSDRTIIENVHERNSVVSHCAVDNQGKGFHADLENCSSKKHKKKKHKGKSKVRCPSDTTISDNLNERNSVVSHFASESQGKVSRRDDENFESEKNKNIKHKNKNNLMSEALENSEGGQEIGRSNKKSKTIYCAGTGDNLDGKSNTDEDLHTSGITITETLNDRNSVIIHCAGEIQGKVSHANVENLASEKHKKKKNKRKSNPTSEANLLDSLGNLEKRQEKCKKVHNVTSDTNFHDALQYSNPGKDMVNTNCHFKTHGTKVITEKKESDDTLDNQATSEVENEKKNKDTNELRNNLLQNALSVFRSPLKSSQGRESLKKAKANSISINLNTDKSSDSVVSSKKKCLKLKRKKKRKQKENEIQQVRKPLVLKALVKPFSASKLDKNSATVSPSNDNIDRDQIKYSETISTKESNDLPNEQQALLGPLNNTCISTESQETMHYNEIENPPYSRKKEKNTKTKPMMVKKKKHKSRERSKKEETIFPKKKKRDTDSFEAMTSKLLSEALKNRNLQK